MHFTGRFSDTTDFRLPFTLSSRPHLTRLASSLALMGLLAGCNIEITPLAENADGTTADTEETASDETATDDSASDDTAESTEPEATVTQSATLYWSAPLERVDGSALAEDDISGFQIRYFADDSPENIELITLEDASARRYDIDSLEQPEHYTFEIATKTTDGLTSEFVEAGN